MLEWKHMKWRISSMDQIDNPQPCPNTQVALIKCLHPETKKLLDLEVVCTQCGRSLSITNYEQN